MLNMEKIVKRYGNSIIITIDKEDQRIYNVQEGDTISLTITKVSKLKEELHGPKKGRGAFKKKK